MPCVKHIDDVQRRARLVVRQHLGRTAADPVAAVTDLVAMHSSDPSTPYLGLWARVPELTHDDVDRALYLDRSLWRLHAMRRTLWITSLADAPAVRAGASVAVAAKERRRANRYVAASVPGGEDVLARLEDAILHELTNADGPVATSVLNDAIDGMRTSVMLGSGKWAQEQPVGPRLLYVMAMEGTITPAQPAGSWRASQYAWASTADWFDGAASGPPLPDGRDGRAQLVQRYLQRFGPATSDDAKWWTGWTVAQTQTALADAGAIAATIHGADAWLAPGDEVDVVAPDGIVALLPALDPTTMGWKARGWYLGSHTAFGGPLFDRNGNVGPTVWRDGQVIGGWAQRSDGQVVTRLLVDVGQNVANAVADQAERLTEWLSDHVVIPRFRTPLEKELTHG